MAAGAEVKIAGGNGEEGLAQLAIWMAAGYAKLRELDDHASIYRKSDANDCQAESSLNPSQATASFKAGSASQHQDPRPIQQSSPPETLQSLLKF